MGIKKLCFIAFLIKYVNCIDKKNIVFIIGDDMGWDDVSFHGSEEARTPNIDALASSGVALQRHYSHAICTPSRSALMTGKFSYRTGMQGYPLTFGEERGLPLTEKIMPQYFKEQGYLTHLIGKWHLGSHKYAYLPTFRGFDTHYGHRGGFIDYYEYTSEQQWASSNGSNFNVHNGFDLFRNVTVDKEAEGYITDIYNNEAINVINNHEALQPLFLIVSHNAPHCGNVGATLQVDPHEIRAKRYIANGERKVYTAMVKKFDDSVGDIIKALDDNGMLNNTIIALIADNGGPTIGLGQNWGSNEPFKGAKSTPWEGGIRTVGVLWSQELAKVNNIWDGYIHGVDWLPTFLDAVGADTPEGIDGVSQWNNILNGEPSDRNQIVEIDDYSEYAAIIIDNYKLVTATEGTGFDLYYGETFKNLTSSPPNYRKTVLKSAAYNVLTKWDLDVETVLKLRENGPIKCGDKVDGGCIPQASLNCLHLQLYRDPRDRFKKGQSKASLSLQQFLGFESGFTLDKESNTIAIICQDVVVALAFETRERLIAWQVKVGSQLGSSKEYLVMIGSGSKRLPAGPARLHLQGRKFAMTAGVPPRLLALWELKHLRRYGVVEGRFCFEGGSHCGKNEGLHVLITDQAHEITDAFDLALHGNPALGRPGGSRKSNGERGNNNRPDTRLSDFNNFDPDTASGLYEENFFGADCGRISPLWSSDERRQSFEDFDAKPMWNDTNQIILERCSNCMMKIGNSSRTCAVSVTPTFNPAWKMDTVPDSCCSGNSSNSAEYLNPLRREDDFCHCFDKPPLRPPKPYHLEPKKPPEPLPVDPCACAANDSDRGNNGNNDKVGPYEDYDVPKIMHSEVPINSEYYDTPKRIKKSIGEDLFPDSKDSQSDRPVVLKKTCGCILKLGSQKKPVIVECEESLQPTDCPCQKVTNWANNLIGLPYCKKTPNASKIKTEVLEVRDISDQKAIYATVDVSRKTNRQSGSISDKDNILSLVSDDTILQNYENIEPVCPEENNICTNYENFEFSLSLEHYENAKHLLKKAGVTQNELDGLSSKIDAPNTLPKKTKLCTKCVHCQNAKETGKKNKSDEYLLMGPGDSERDPCQSKVRNLGYTPMCPNPNWSHSLKHPQSRNNTSTPEKYVSSPTLHSDNILSNPKTQEIDVLRIENRTSSVDSERRLDDLNEYDSSNASHVTSSSLETLRNMAIDVHHQDSSSNEGVNCTPALRNKLMDNAQIKRSSSVPCKNRDSSSSNDSGVSSCSMKHQDFEAPITSTHSGHKYMVHKKLRGNLSGCLHSSLPRKSKSSDPLRDKMIQIHVPGKSTSAEAEVPVLPPKQFKGIVDTHSTSSGTSDMSDYFETLSISSSQSSDTQMNTRLNRQPTNTLRPRSGKEYQNIDPVITSMYKSGKDLANYTNIP